jgi:DNA-binding response OmpR family regulator
MRKKILLVDDNEELLEVLRLSLQDAGFSIITATDGIEALKKARTVLPDLILLDLMLPGMDGFAVCETLRRDPTTASLPVLMLSGMSGQLPKYAGLESGGTDFISKPASPASLIARIREILPA